MMWLAVDSDDKEFIYTDQPLRGTDIWVVDNGDCTELPAGTIKKMTGRRMTWSDEPIEAV